MAVILPETDGDGPVQGLSEDEPVLGGLSGPTNRPLRQILGKLTVLKNDFTNNVKNRRGSYVATVVPNTAAAPVNMLVGRFYVVSELNEGTGFAQLSLPAASTAQTGGVVIVRAGISFNYTGSYGEALHYNSRQVAVSRLAGTTDVIYDEVLGTAGKVEVLLAPGETAMFVSNGSGIWYCTIIDGRDCVKPGTVIYSARQTPLDGYLVCNGAAVSRTAYARLFMQIGTTYGAGDGTTTFNLPNGVGRFLRGWDSTNPLDPGRAFGSTQAGTIIGLQVSNSATFGLFANVLNARETSVTPVLARNLSTLGTAVTPPFNTDYTIRPDNIAMLPLIKF